MSGTLPPDIQETLRAPAEARAYHREETVKTTTRVTHIGTDGRPVTTETQKETTTKTWTGSIQPYDVLALGCVLVGTLALVFLANGQLGPKTGVTIITALLGLAGWAEFAATRKRRKQRRPQAK